MSGDRRRGSRIGLFVREAAKNVAMAPVLTTVTVLTISVSLLLVGFFGFVAINVDRALEGVGNDLRVTLYLDAEALDMPGRDALIRKIEERDEVEEVEFLSAEDDRRRNEDLLSADLLEGLDEAAIPGQECIEVKLAPRQRHKEDFAKLTSWLEELCGADFVEDIHFDAENIRVLFAIADLAETTGLIICIIVLIAAVFFTFSTIKLAVYARREEIEVLRLVGATNAFIRAPFHIEGALAGLAGSAIAFGIVAVIHGRLEQFMAEEHFMNLSLDLMPPGMILWLFLGGMALGLIGSSLSVSRHLRER